MQSPAEKTLMHIKVKNVNIQNLFKAISHILQN